MAKSTSTAATMSTTEIQTRAQTEFEKSAADFRAHIPDLEIDRFRVAKHQTPYEYSEAFQTNHVPPWLYNLTEIWKELLEEPYHGITCDGNVILDLYHSQDEGVPISAIVKSAEDLLRSLDSKQKSKLCFATDAQEWRAWSNPEFLLRPFGLRLEEQSEQTRSLIHKILSTTLSEEGYAKALAAMRINHFLGQVVQLPNIMNKDSYNFLLFGELSETSAWGFSLYGHHLCLNVFLQGPQIIIAPTFTGAEPNLIDSGPWAGTSILHSEGDLGLKLMQSLTREQQIKAQIFKLMRDPAMKQNGDLKTDRWNQDDQRHLCGAFRDNRIIPYEGVLVCQMTPIQQSLVLNILEQFLLYYPTHARELRKKQIAAHFNTTYFSWIGGFSNEDAFYFRLQSPVIVAEFDHHSGVFLTNTEPAKYHTHTLLRLPNAGDYGNALRKREERVP